VVKRKRFRVPTLVFVAAAAFVAQYAVDVQHLAVVAPYSLLAFLGQAIIGRNQVLTLS